MKFLNYINKNWAAELDRVELFLLIGTAACLIPMVWIIAKQIINIGV